MSFEDLYGPIYSSDYSPDQSDKEMFDAQLISILESKIKALKEWIDGDAQMISTLKDRVKELEEGIRKTLKLAKCGAYYNDTIENLEALLPKEKP
jgi:predicted RNase H-like nuclease (RuvC/YqgF family)